MLGLLGTCIISFLIHLCSPPTPTLRVFISSYLQSFISSINLQAEMLLAREDIDVSPKTNDARGDTILHTALVAGIGGRGDGEVEKLGNRILDLGGDATGRSGHAGKRVLLTFPLFNGDVDGR